MFNKVVLLTGYGSILAVTRVFLICMVLTKGVDLRCNELISVRAISSELMPFYHF